MAGESSLLDQVKTLQRHMGLFGKAFKDMTERVKALEENAKVDDRKEIKDDVNKRMKLKASLKNRNSLTKLLLQIQLLSVRLMKNYWTWAIGQSLTKIKLLKEKRKMR